MDKAEELWKKLEHYIYTGCGKTICIEEIQKALDEAQLEGHDIGMKRAKIRIMEIIDNVPLCEHCQNAMDIQKAKIKEEFNVKKT